MRTAWIFTAFVACFLATGPLAGQVTPPAPPDAVFRVTFRTSEDPAPHSATAFLVTDDPQGEPLVLSAYHVFARRGLARDSAFSSADLDTLLVGVALRGLADSLVAVEAGAHLAIPGARGLGGEACFFVEPCLDLAAFTWPHELALQPLRLAEQPPEIGGSVWLFARFRGDAAQMGLLHGGVSTVLST